MENNKIQQYNVTRNPFGFRVFLHTALRMLIYGSITKSRAQDAYEKLIIKDGKINENVSTETVQGYEKLLKRAVD